LKEYPLEKREVFPLQFQRGLLRAKKNQVPGKLNQFARDYAQLMVNARPNVVEWKKYNEDLPFWVNCVRIIKSMCKGEQVNLESFKNEISRKMVHPESAISEARHDSIWDSLKKLLWNMPLV